MNSSTVAIHYFFELDHSFIPFIWRLCLKIMLGICLYQWNLIFVFAQVGGDGSDSSTMVNELCGCLHLAKYQWTAEWDDIVPNFRATNYGQWKFEDSCLSYLLVACFTLQFRCSHGIPWTFDAPLFSCYIVQDHAMHIMRVHRSYFVPSSYLRYCSYTDNACFYMKCCSFASSHRKIIGFPIKCLVSWMPFLYPLQFIGRYRNSWHLICCHVSLCTRFCLLSNK